MMHLSCTGKMHGACKKQEKDICQKEIENRKQGNGKPEGSFFKQFSNDY
jgi:hypothetical protein